MWSPLRSCLWNDAFPESMQIPCYCLQDCMSTETSGSISSIDPSLGRAPIGICNLAKFDSGKESMPIKKSDDHPEVFLSRRVFNTLLYNRGNSQSLNSSLN